MIISPEHLIQLMWEIAGCLGVGVPLLTVIGAAILHRLTNVFDAYAGERAKLQVQFNNVEKLVEQTRVLTATTESIKAKVTDDTWVEQQRRLRRFEAYSGIIEQLENYHGAVIKLANFKLAIRDAPSDPEQSLKERIDRDRDAAIEKYNAALSAWSHAKAVALILCDDEAVALTERLEIPDNPSLAALHKTNESVKVLMKEFAVVARRDLGYPALRTKDKNGGAASER